jgi:hypothetical protein
VAPQIAEGEVLTGVLSTAIKMFLPVYAAILQDLMLLKWQSRVLFLVRSRTHLGHGIKGIRLGNMLSETSASRWRSFPHACVGRKEFES